MEEKRRRTEKSFFIIIIQGLYLSMESLLLNISQKEGLFYSL
jgi:hypothetical protein